MFPFEERFDDICKMKVSMVVNGNTRRIVQFVAIFWQIVIFSRTVATAEDIVGMV